MEVSTITTEDGALLGALRSSLADAERALLCVAFVSDAGVHLLRQPFEQLGDRAQQPRSPLWDQALTSRDDLLLAKRETAAFTRRRVTSLEGYGTT